jgi:DNA primase
MGVPLASGDDRARALAYCAERGIPEYVIEEMRLGVCVEGRFANRLIFPVFDSGGRLIFYQGRAMWKPAAGAKHIKTLSPRVEHDGQAGAGDVLLNLDFLKAAGALPRRVAVVEGPIDCAHAWPDAVASFGKHLSSGQIEQLVKAGVREIDLCWDADAIRDALRVSASLADLFAVRVVEFPDGKDPGDLSKAEIEYHRGRAVRVGNRLERVGGGL